MESEDARYPVVNHGRGGIQPWGRGTPWVKSDAPTRSAGVATPTRSSPGRSLRCYCCGKATTGYPSGQSLLEEFLGPEGIGWHAISGLRPRRLGERAPYDGG